MTANASTYKRTKYACILKTRLPASDDRLHQVG